MSKKILIIEDDDDIAELLKIQLRDAGFTIDRASDGASGLVKAVRQECDLIILDIMLPGLDGLAICRQLREEDIRVPILMLTAKIEESDKVVGLDAGADDYMTKPFGIDELLARVRALLRRMEAIAAQGLESSGPPKLDFGELVIDQRKRAVAVRGGEVNFTAMEFDLLAFLASNPGRTFTRQELLSYVWEYEFVGYEHTVNSHVNRVRAKIEPDPSKPRFILTVWGVGYRFVESSEL